MISLLLLLFLALHGIIGGILYLGWLLPKTSENTTLRRHLRYFGVTFIFFGVCGYVLYFYLQIIGIVIWLFTSIALSCVFTYYLYRNLQSL